MDTVVIVDSSKKILDNYKRMLEACKEKINCKYFKFPEEAVDYIRREGAAVLVCELELPVMTGKEVFDMVEIISPATVRIAMSQVEDISRTLEIVNHSRIFKLIIKPIFLPEDMMEPIQAALRYYKLQEKERMDREEIKVELDMPEQKTRELVSELERKTRNYDNLYRIMSGILEGNLECGGTELSQEEKREAVRVCEGLLQGFLRYYMFGAQNYIFHMNYLTKLFHAPQENRNFQLKKQSSQEIPNEIMQRMAYTIFTTGYFSRERFGQYQIKAAILEAGQGYVFNLSVKLPGKAGRAAEPFGQAEEKGRLTELFRQAEEKLHGMFGDRFQKETTEGWMKENIYYKKGETGNE